MPSQPSERELVEQAQLGDQAARDALFKACMQPLQAHLRGKIPERHQTRLTIDDVIQDTFIEAIESLAKFAFRGEGSFVAWLCNIADCNLADAIRSLDTDKRGGGWNQITPRNPEDTITHLYETLTMTTASMHAARKENGTRLHEAIAKLGPAYQAVVRGFDLEGRPMEAVAAEMGRTVGAAYMLRVRAHRRLREILGSSGRYFGPRE